MNAMRDTLAIMREVEDLKTQLEEAERERTNAELDIETLALAICALEDFKHWLLCQDSSSAITYCGSMLKKSSIKIEDADDRSLILAWARSSYASQRHNEEEPIIHWQRRTEAEARRIKQKLRITA